MDQVAAVKLGRNRNGQAQLAPRRLHLFRFRNCSDEVSAQHEESGDAARDDSLAGFDSIHPLVARRFETELRGQEVERNQFRFFRNSDCSLALNVRMAADGTNPGSGLADVSA